MEGVVAATVTAFAVGMLRFIMCGLAVLLGIGACELARSLVVLWKLESCPSQIRGPDHIAQLLGMATLGVLLMEWFAPVGLTRLIQWSTQASLAWAIVMPVLMHGSSAIVGGVGLSAAWKWRMRGDNRQAVLSVIVTIVLMAAVHAGIARLLLHPKALDTLTFLVETVSATMQP